MPRAVPGLYCDCGAQWERTMARMLVRTTVAATLALLPGTALAHTGGDTSGFVHGLMHPISGVDHVLAMIAVGLYAAHLGGRALWLVPASFVALMSAGGALGFYGVGLPYVEVGVVASVIVL